MTEDKASTSTVVDTQWPVVVNSSLQDSDITRMLSQQKHKLRYSDSSIPNTFIFPLSAVAFMVLPLSDAALEWPPKSGNIKLDEDIYDRLEKFVKVHKNCFLLALASLHGQHERAVMSEIQKRFMCSPMRILPAHNASDCVQCMTTVAKYSVWYFSKDVKQ
ncbi:protein SPO16 homolog isoform X1 [Amphiura filiformis]|uniref:protein SPO16 homolog isoform X1 n=1 Tax=Amphiura filiformis TaxID=82378 RepID=UPI003B21E45F